MRRWLRWALRLGLVERRDIFTTREALPVGCLVIPPGTQIKGQLQTNAPIWVAGHFEGSLCIQGHALLCVAPGGVVSSGDLTAHAAHIQGELRDVTLDADDVRLDAGARVAGRSLLRYARLLTDPQASLDAHLQKRTQPNRTAAPRDPPP